MTLDIIYDGQCRFCIRSLAAVRFLDTRGCMRFHDANLPETRAAFPQISPADTNDAMFVIASGEQPHRGFFAFRRLAWAGPLLWPSLLLFYFPAASIVGPRIYELIARNRQRLGCYSDSCSLTPGQPAK